jgi:hypothetical protein
MIILKWVSVEIYYDGADRIRLMGGETFETLSAAPSLSGRNLSVKYILKRSDGGL